MEICKLSVLPTALFVAEANQLCAEIREAMKKLERDPSDIKTNEEFILRILRTQLEEFKP